MSDITELDSRLNAALERIGRGVDALQVPVSEPDDGEDVQALRRALENEALVTAQMEERLRSLTARQAELEAELATEQEALAAAQSQASEDAAAVEATVSAAKDEMQAEFDVQIATLNQAQADALAEAQLEAQATAAEGFIAPEAEDESAPASGIVPQDNRALLDELAKRLRRLRQMARRERTANQVLRTQAEKEISDPDAINEALKADIETLSALREAEMAETALILAELRPLLEGPVFGVDDALESTDTDSDSDMDGDMDADADNDPTIIDARADANTGDA